jgi:hypothetical protein
MFEVVMPWKHYGALFKFARAPCGFMKVQQTLQYKIAIKKKKGDHELVVEMETRSNVFEFLCDFYTMLNCYSVDE